MSTFVNNLTTDLFVFRMNLSSNKGRYAYNHNAPGMNEMVTPGGIQNLIVYISLPTVLY